MKELQREEQKKEEEEEQGREGDRGRKREREEERGREGGRENLPPISTYGLILQMAAMVRFGINQHIFKCVKHANSVCCYGLHPGKYSIPT